MFNDNFLRHLSRSRVQDALRASRQTTQQRYIEAAPVTIRHAAAPDLPSLERLAALDSRRVPSGELFVAEVDGRLVAATSIDTGAVIADPFEHTASIVELLRVHSRAVRPAPSRIDEPVAELFPAAV
jgi:hypothetical protein